MSTQPEMRAGSAPHILSPQELAYEVDNSLRLQHERKLLRVSGIFCDKKRQKTYGGFAYDALLDPTSQHSLTLIVPLGLKERLRDGRAYAFRGYLERKVSSGELNIGVSFRVSGVENFDLPSYEEILVKRSDVFHAKCSRGFKRVEGVILERLRTDGGASITLLHGVDAVVDKDVRVRLDGISGHIRITWKSVSLSNKSAIITALNELDEEGESDVIGIIRGGGDLKIFNDAEIAHAAAEMDTPLVTAIGHAVDLSLCDQVADKHFATPTALAVFLEEMVKRAGEEFARERRLRVGEAALAEKEADFSRRQNQILQKLADTQQTAGAARGAIGEPPAANSDWRVRALCLAAGIVLGVIASVLIMRGLNRTQSSPIPAQEPTLQAQPAPSASPSPTAPPGGDGRRKRR